MTHVFVWTLRDIVGLSLLGLCVVTYAVIALIDWREKKRRGWDKLGKGKS